MAAYDDAIKSCGNPLFGQLAREGGNRPKFDMATCLSDPRYTTSPTSSSAPRDVDSRPQRFAAAVGQVGWTTPQDVVRTAGRRDRKRRWEPGGVEFEKLAMTVEAMVSLGQKALGKAERRQSTKRGKRAGSHVQGRRPRPKDPETGRFVAGGEGVVSSRLDKRESTVGDSLVGLVASGVPHRRDRAKFKEERKKRKAAQKEAAKLRKTLKMVHDAAAAEAKARATEDAKGKSEVEARVAEWERKAGEARAESEEARQLLEAQVVQVGETVEAERRGREKAVEREQMGARRREEAEARVVELEREMGEKEKAAEEAQIREVRAMREVRLGEEVERRRQAEARVAGLEEEAESRVASMRKEKEEAFARALAVAKTAAGREAELREKAQEKDMLEREVAGLKKEVRVGVSKLAPGSRPIQARFDDQGRLYWVDVASGRCTWAWPGQGSPPSAEAIKEAQPQMADVRPTRKARKKDRQQDRQQDREQDRHKWDSRMGGEQYGGQVYGWR